MLARVHVAAARPGVGSRPRTCLPIPRYSVVKYIVCLARTSLPLQKRLVAMSSSLKARFTSPDRRPVYEAAAASLSISIDREDVISSALRNLGESCASSTSFEDFGARNTPHLEADSPLIWICFDRAPCRPCAHQRAAATRLRHQLQVEGLQRGRQRLWRLETVLCKHLCMYSWSTCIIALIAELCSHC